LGLDPENAAVRAKLARLSRRRSWRRRAVAAAGLLIVSAAAGGVWALASRVRPGRTPEVAAPADSTRADPTPADPTATGPGPARPPADPTAEPPPEPRVAASPQVTPAAARLAGHLTTLAVHVRPYAQRALLDGVEVARGEQVVRFALAPGKAHLVQIEHACCAPFVRQITAEEASRMGELRVPLEPRPARLRVDGEPTTRVLVEGRLLGTAGDSQRVPLPVDVPPGGTTPYEATAHLTLEQEGGTRREVRVTLRAGAETIVPGPGAETVVPAPAADVGPEVESEPPAPVSGVEEIR
ncbi:MAG TPA: serine/threonine protein kinase, partial [Anaeromyxobacter sp.]